MGAVDVVETVREDDRATVGWRELLADAIGVQPGSVDVSWEAVLDDRAEIALAELRAAWDELGRPPTREEWDRSGRRPASRTFVRYFGSWREACWAVDLSALQCPASRKPAAPNTPSGLNDGGD